MLSGIKRILLTLLLLVLGVGVLLLILQNPQNAQFHFLYWITPVLPFSIFLAMAFGLGALTALLFGLWLSGRNGLRRRRSARSSLLESK